MKLPIYYVVETPWREKMKSAYIQEWEESERGWGVRPDGASVHKTQEGLEAFVKENWGNRQTIVVPDEYSRPRGAPYFMNVPNEVYNRIGKEDGTWVGPIEFYNIKKDNQSKYKNSENYR